MPTYNQAPVIKYKGNKLKDSKGWGKTIRTHELEWKFMSELGERDMAMLKIMLFLTGNAEGFAVAEKTICDRCNISSSGYRTARKKLSDKGWITCDTSNKTITVNYNVIFGDETASEKGSVPTSSENRSEEERQENSEETISENRAMGISENTPETISENTHNNIRNSINNNISCGDDCGQAHTQVISGDGSSLEKPILISVEKLMKIWNDCISLKIPGVVKYGDKFYLQENKVEEYKKAIKDFSKQKEEKKKYRF